jgi:hypothetical protein
MPESSDVLNEVGQGLSVQSRELGEIDRIDPALARLRLGDERLRALKGLRDLDLGHSGGFAGGAQPLEHCLVQRPVGTTYPAH